MAARLCHTDREDLKSLLDFASTPAEKALYRHVGSVLRARGGDVNGLGSGTTLMEEALTGFATRKRKSLAPPTPSRLRDAILSLPSTLRVPFGDSGPEWPILTIAAGRAWRDGVVERWFGPEYEAIRHDEEVIRGSGSTTLSCNLVWSWAPWFKG
jgi:hypothetical protein